MRGAPLLEAAPSPWETSRVVEVGNQIIIAICWPERPFTMNETRRMHFRVERKLVQHWRDTFSELAAGAPRLARAELRIWHEVGRRIIPDHAACAPAAKAALDGCVDRLADDGTPVRGILADDSPAYIQRLIFEAPLFTGRYAMTLEFRGDPE